MHPAGGPGGSAPRVAQDATAPPNFSLRSRRFRLLASIRMGYTIKQTEWKMQDTLRQLLGAFLVVGLLLGAGVAISKAVPRWRAYQVCCAERERLQGEVDGIRQQITDTKRNIDRFNRSPYYVEYLARANHRVAENEIVLIFED